MTPNGVDFTFLVFATTCCARSSAILHCQHLLCKLISVLLYKSLRCKVAVQDGCDRWLCSVTVLKVLKIFNVRPRAAHLHLLWVLLIHLHHSCITCEQLPVIHWPDTHHHLYVHIAIDA